MGLQYTQNEICFSPAGLCHVNVIVWPAEELGREGGNTFWPLCLLMMAPREYPQRRAPSSAPTRQATMPVPTGHGGGPRKGRPGAPAVRERFYETQIAVFRWE